MENKITLPEQHKELLREFSNVLLSCGYGNCEENLYALRLKLYSANYLGRLDNSYQHLRHACEKLFEMCKNCPYANDRWV